MEPNSFGEREKVFLNGQWWYYTQDKLIKALGKMRQNVALMVMRNVRGQNGPQIVFSNFTDPYSLNNFLGRIREGERCLNEVPMPSQVQKLRFDIDMQGSTAEDADFLVGTLVWAIYTVLGNLGVTMDIQRDVFVFQSHRLKFTSSGSPKFSNHIIVDNWACFGAEEYSQIYNHIVKQTEILLGSRSQLAEYIDVSLSYQKHPLRIFGCTKLGEWRPKKWEPSWTLWTPTGPFRVQTLAKQDPLPEMSIMKSSLITFAEYCKIIPVPAPDPSMIEGSRYSADVELLDDVSDQVEDWLKTTEDGDCFKMGEPRGSIIPLQRVQPGFCVLCDRKHEHENAYLIVLKSGDEGKPRVIFKCHRNQGRSTEVCSDATAWVVTEDGPPIPEQEQETPKIRRCHYLEAEEQMEALARGDGLC